MASLVVDLHDKNLLSSRFFLFMIIVEVTLISIEIATVSKFQGVFITDCGGGVGSLLIVSILLLQPQR